MKPKVLSSEIAHQNRWYHVRHDKLEWKSGVLGDYYVVVTPPSCVIVCEKNDALLVVEQYRHTTDCTSLEFPMGTVNADESPEEAARRELKEETGYTAQALYHIGSYFCANGYGHILQHVFAAPNAEPTNEQKLDESELDMQRTWLPIDEWKHMILHKEKIDSESLAAWSVYQAWKEQRKNV